MLPPKLFYTLKGYTRVQFFKDVMSGCIVGIVALPLAIAFAIASGVSPEKGLITAVVAGFIISAFGGSRVQIGGPTGAFIVIVFGIIQQYGFAGLVGATFLGGILLILMGFFRLGAIIKFIPHPLITGFTTGIAVIIFSGQIKDFFGLQMEAVPADFIDKWVAFAAHIQSFNFISFAIALFTTIFILFWPKVSTKIPGSLLALVLTTAVVQVFHLDVPTIGSRFGSIPNNFPVPQLPSFNWHLFQQLLRPAFTIALLGGIESLLSAVVADGMIGSKTRNNTELVAQGMANIASSMFGGLPATGAIARTATNVKNGGRTPVAGIIHAVTLLIIMLFAAPWASMIPMASLAGILVVVAWHMSGYASFMSILRGDKSEAAVLLTTFLLTIFIDLTVAIELGMIVASFLFMRRMMQASTVKHLTSNPLPLSNQQTSADYLLQNLPTGVEAYEIHGPLFFGAAYKFKEAMYIIEKKVKVLIIRMNNVPVIDGTGISILKEVINDCKKRQTKIILSEVYSTQVMNELQKNRLLFSIGKANVLSTFEAAIERSKKLVEEA